MLGEVEGKDNKPVDVQKLSQLIRSLGDDLERVEEVAKGVLMVYGNRLVPLDERVEVFTQHCIKSAQSRNIALVATTDLFKAVQYLVDHNDANYAKQCRDAIVNGVGVVSFPTVPEKLDTKKTLI